MSRTPQVAKRVRRKPKYRFTREDCQRGYRAALAKCMESWELYAWLYYRYVAKFLCGVQWFNRSETVDAQDRSLLSCRDLFAIAD